MNTLEPAVSVRGIHKSFGSLHAVRGVDLEIKRGEIRGFLGPNGSGKTTFMRILCGLLTPDAGEGTCLGFDLTSAAQEIKRRVGYMTQRFSLYEDLSVQENLSFIARMFSMPRREKAVANILQQLNLTSRRNQLAGTLSGGWKQRLALAACLIHEPELLLLDEPTAGVDPRARRDFWDEIHALSACGLTVLVSTHYMDEAERCNKLAYIFEGKLLVSGSAEKILNSQKLCTWRATGPDLQGLAARLRCQRGVDQVVTYGNSLHVSGRDANALASAIQVVSKAPNQWEKIETSLEDVFISLTGSGQREDMPTE